MTDFLKKRKKTSFITIFIIVFLRVFVVEPYIVPSESMSRTMENGDIVIATKYNYGFSRMSIPFLGGFMPFWKSRIMKKDPKRGDVICFSLDKEPGKLYTKRIIGIGGDKVQLKNGMIIVNDNKLKMEYKSEYNLRHDDGRTEMMDVFNVILPSGKSYEILRRKPDNQSYYNKIVDNTPVFEIPKGHVFCMGDNMHFSKDFRFFDFTSSIPYERIIGKPTFIIFGSSARLKPENNWVKWILRLPYSVFMSLINVKWSRIGRFI